MYKFELSCYYWPAEEGRLRLQSLLIKDRFEQTTAGLNYSRVIRLANVDNFAPTDRRIARRFSAKCEAELIASLSILDSEANVGSESLTFLGHITDLSARGLGLVLPSTRIDERYCRESDRLKLSIHLPRSKVTLELNPVRWVPLNPSNVGQGYFLGAKIVEVTEERAEFERYLQAL